MDKSRGIKQQYLVFETSGEVFALPIEVVAEVLPMVTLVSVPSQPPFVQGFLDWQDGAAPVAVLRLDTLLRLSHPAEVPGLHTPILILRGVRALGLLIEKVRGLIVATPQVLRGEDTVLQNSFNGCVNGLLPVGESDTPAAILAVDRLLLVEEQDRLDAFAALAEERRAAMTPADESVTITA